VHETDRRVPNDRCNLDPVEDTVVTVGPEKRPTRSIEDRGDVAGELLARWSACRPFLGLGAACVTVGGVVAAITGPAGLELGSWTGGYLVLVGGVAPILFGLDKFLDWLVDWEIYLAPEINDLVPGNAHEAMLAIGIIEIVAGIAVAVRPRFGGYLVAAWLAGIIANLLLQADYYDIALRDFGLLLAALTLARLATAFDQTPARR